MSLYNQLPPGLYGYAAAQQAGQEQDAQELRRQQAVMQMMQVRSAIAQREREDQERKRKEAAVSALRADPRFKGLGHLLEVAPIAAVERAIPKPQKQESPFSRLDPKDYTPESLRKYQLTRDVADLVAAPKPAADGDFTRALLESGVQRGSPQWVAAHAERAKKLQTSSPLVQIGTEETAFQKKFGAEMGEQYANLMKADMNAPATVGRYERLGQLLSNVNTGKFKGTTTELKAAAKALGIDLNAMGIKDDVAPAQAARALSNQLALELRNPAGGAGMPGALSDKDREFLVASLPTLESDPGAIGLMIEYRVKLAKREQEVARMARAYRKKHGKFDEDFFDELAEWSEKNRLFPDKPPAPKPAAPAAAGTALTPAEQKELEELRKKYRQ